MAQLNLRWQSKAPTTTKTVEEQVSSNPIIAYILTQKKIGTPKKVIIEKLMQQGFSYRNIRTAFTTITKIKTNRLDWRSPTSINETARMIRRDIRNKKISYSIGMKLLLKARNMLRTMITNTRTDKRLWQIQKEIKITKKLLMNQYANPLMIQQYKIMPQRK